MVWGSLGEEIIHMPAMPLRTPVQAHTGPQRATRVAGMQYSESCVIPLNTTSPPDLRLPRESLNK
jgi:hypothetical protein